MTAPALTARIWWIVLRNEWLKARKRLAFMLPVGFYLFITAMIHGGSAWEASRDPDDTYALPEAWQQILGDEPGMFLMLFASVSLILLVSSEFTWRTARQNVIDGLSKTQWFGGKVMLVPLVGLVFMGVALPVATIVAAIGTDFGVVENAFPASVFAATGGQFLAYMTSASLALFVALAIRSTGGATAIWFLWIVPMEQLIIPIIFGRFEALRGSIEYQPFTVAQQLLGFEKYDAATFQRFVDRAVQAGREIPTQPDLTTQIWVSVGWTIVFIAGSYVMFKRRDL